MHSVYGKAQAGKKAKVVSSHKKMTVKAIEYGRDKRVREESKNSNISCRRMCPGCSEVDFNNKNDTEFTGMDLLLFTNGNCPFRVVVAD